MVHVFNHDVVNSAPETIVDRFEQQPLESLRLCLSIEVPRLGANIVDPLETKPSGLRQFTVEDLDGNRFYFHHD